MTDTEPKGPVMHAVGCADCDGIFCTDGAPAFHCPYCCAGVDAFRDAMEQYTRAPEQDPAQRIDEVKVYRAALKEILWLGEQHTESAVGRRIADFRSAITVARAAIEVAAKQAEGEG